MAMVGVGALMGQVEGPRAQVGGVGSRIRMGVGSPVSISGWGEVGWPGGEVPGPGCGGVSGPGLRVGERI